MKYFNFKMNWNFIYPFIILLFVSCSNEADSQKGKTIVSGQVSNFEKVLEHDYIEIIYEDILDGKVNLVEYIDKNGQFKFVLDLDYPTEFHLKYSGLLNFYIAPHDSLYFHINGDCLLDTTMFYKEEYKYYVVSGTSEKMNHDFVGYHIQFPDSFNNSDFHNNMINNSTPVEYKTFVEELTKKRFKIVENFNKTNNTCLQFKDWVSLKLKYDAWVYLLKYRWLHPMHTKTDINTFRDSIPSDYFDFLLDWDKEKKEQLKSKSYLRFLQEYHLYVNNGIPLDSQKVYRALYNSDFEKSMSFLLRYYQSVETGFIKDVLISKFYNGLLNSKFYEKTKSIYYPELIEDQYLNARVQEKFELERKLFENPQFADGINIHESAIEEDFLKYLKEKYPNKVLFIDFWAPWCFPCMREMSPSKKIKRHFDDKDVIFIYLANQCEKGAWKSTIADKMIEGEHFHLTNKQYAKLVQAFEIKGIPHYALINKSGKVIRKKAPRPSSGEELINLIEKQLE